MNAAAITIHNLCKRFGRTKALDRVSLQIPQGVVFALLGENGAGKTTLIRILTGFLKPDEGEATVLGQSSIKSSMEIRRGIGYVSDSPALYDWMTSEEIGWFASAFYDDQFSTRYLKLLGDYEIPAGVKIKHMSRGQRAKVALALATAHDPSLLILDEPTSGLDPMVRRQFLESMVDRAALGRTVFLSSHQINEVERVADWVAILHQGTLKLVQPLDALRQSTWIVTATLDDPAATLPLPSGRVLTESRNGRQLRWVVQDLAQDWKSQYGSDSGAADLHAEAATLEEVFVAVCDDRAQKPQVASDAPVEPLSPAAWHSA